jgi:thymidylate synthase ThyX
MKVILAGFNVDTEALREYKKKNVTLTPESIAAAYARISRSPQSVTMLRKEAREEIEKARKSNRTIIFDMGHHSIAEHAVFNFDVIGISRRAVEDLETFRLCSYTEKSQRYVTLKGDFIIPKELKNTDLL